MAKSMIIQSLLFDVGKYTVEEAKGWLDDHDYKNDKVDTTDQYHRFRQRDPGDFDESTFKTVEVTDGVKSVMGKLKEKSFSVPEYLSDCKDELKHILVKSEKPEVMREERSIVHFISTADLDRGRDVMNPKGMDDKDFSGAPSVWYNHEYRFNDHALPVAKSLWRKTKENGVLAKTQFAPTDFADDVYRLHVNGFIESWSIGWMPKRDNKGNVKEGSIVYDEKKNTTYYNEWTLLEYSSAPLAMNPNARDQLKSLSEMQFKSLLTQEIVEKSKLEFQIGELKPAFEKALEELKTMKDLLEDLILRTGSNENDIIDLIKLIGQKQTIISNEIKKTIEKPKKFNIDIDAVVKRSLKEISAAKK